MPRTSIARLMGVVLFIAVGLGAAMAGAFTFAVVAISATTLGGVLARGRPRAFLLGCAAFGWTSMLLTSGPTRHPRYPLPADQLIARVYEAINGPGPATFPSPEAAGQYITHLALDLNRAITTGYALISLAVALIGGAATWLVARMIVNRRDDPVSVSMGNPEP